MSKIWCFKIHFSKYYLQKKFVYIFVISTLSIPSLGELTIILNTTNVIRSQVDMAFHCFYLEITWKIHGISCHQRTGNPVIENVEKNIINNYFVREIPSKSEVWASQQL